MEAKPRCLKDNGLIWLCSATHGRSHYEHLPRNFSHPLTAYPEDPSSQYSWIPLIPVGVYNLSCQATLVCCIKLKASKRIAFSMCSLKHSRILCKFPEKATFRLPLIHGEITIMENPLYLTLCLKVFASL